MRAKGSKSVFRQPRLAILIAAGLTTASGGAQAFKIASDNPDVAMRWDNTIRYNAAWRLKDRNPGIANNAAQDENEYLFDKGDIVLNRVDLFSEFDFTYQRSMGFRVSGALWYDAAYDDKGKSHPALAAGASYPGNQFTDYVKRYYQGPSGEFADAFVWKNFSLLGDNNLNVKAGRFAVLWGVPVFGTAAANSVSVDMAPSDGQKQALSPGATAKETTLPIAQTIASWQINNRISLAAQYTYEWRPTRLPEGGTYFGVADAILYGPVRANAVFPRANQVKGENGDWGLTASWNPEWVPAGTYIGFYLREFDQKTPTWASNLVGATFSATTGAPTSGVATAVFGKDVKLWGLSLDTTVLGAAVGAEISHRKNQPLNINPGASVHAIPGFEGPKGETWHALLNFTKVFNVTSLWDTANLIGELAYQRLDKLTDNAALYKSKATTPAICVDEIVQGCSTKDAYHLSLLFGPTIQQILPSWDLNWTFLYQTGLKGNAPTTGINEGASLIQIAGEMLYVQKHSFKLAYTNYYGKAKYLSTTTGPGNAGPTQTVNGTFGNYGDRDTIQFTYAYTF